MLSGSTLVRMASTFLHLDHEQDLSHLDVAVSSSCCDCERGQYATRADNGGYNGGRWTPQYECSGERTAVESVENHAQEVVPDAGGRVGEIRDLAGQSSVYRLPQQLRRQTRLHTAHEPIRRFGEAIRISMFSHLQVLHVGRHADYSYT